MEKEINSLSGIPGEVNMVITIKRALTNKEETYSLIGYVDLEQLKQQEIINESDA